MGLKVTAFVANHWHDDCIGGLNYVHSLNIKSYANNLTIEIARAKGKNVPQNGFTDSLKLMLGDKEIHCYYMGAAHSVDNIVVWIPSEKLLFPGCMCKSIDSQNLGNTADGDLKEYPKTIEKVIRKFGSAKIIVPGHGAPGRPELLVHTLSLVKN
jgi:metallo-beta-lactamase class B